MCDDNLLYAGLSELQFRSAFGIAAPFVALYMTGIAKGASKDAERIRAKGEIKEFLEIRLHGVDEHNLIHVVSQNLHWAQMVCLTSEKALEAHAGETFYVLMQKRIF